MGQRRRRRWFRLRRAANFQRVNPDRISDVLELRRAEIADGEIEPASNLTIGVFGKTDRARLGDAFQPRGDVDAITHQVAVALLDHVAEMNAYSEHDALIFGRSDIALRRRVLHRDRASYRFNDAAE